MRISDSFAAALPLILLLPFAANAADSKKDPPKPCTVFSSTSGSFFDLRPLTLTVEGTKSQFAANESYHVRGYDYGTNFTLNFCGPVIEELHDVEDVSRTNAANISAFYKDTKGDVFSLGVWNEYPVVRGRKLVMNYTGGSYCPKLDEDGEPIEISDLDRRSLLRDDDNEREDMEINTTKSKSSKRRKSTLLSFICDTSPLLSGRPAISFVGSPDHCTYFFEVRSRYACANATPSGEKGTLGPAGVFAMIFGIGVLVYLIGGIVYQRNVMHQRGWKQLPNYGLWAGLFGFVSDMFVILFSSCTQHMPSMNRMFNSKRGGYHRVGSEDRRNGRIGRGRTSDDENRLIDDLNEEWDD